MDDLLEAIRAAVTAGAAPEARAAGAAACRSILAALDATSGQPMVTAAPASPAPAIANIVSALRGVPPDQLLDLAIAKLRAALPAGVDVARPAPLNFNIVPIPPRRG
jgi:hypothetical protein